MIVRIVVTNAVSRNRDWQLGGYHCLGVVIKGDVVITIATGNKVIRCWISLIPVIAVATDLEARIGPRKTLLGFPQSGTGIFHHRRSCPIIGRTTEMGFRPILRLRQGCHTYQQHGDQPLHALAQGRKQVRSSPIQGNTLRQHGEHSLFLFPHPRARQINVSTGYRCYVSYPVYRKNAASITVYTPPSMYKALQPSAVIFPIVFFVIAKPFYFYCLLWPC